MRYKTLLFIAIIGLILVSCQKTVTEYYPNGQIRSVIEKRGGENHGKAVYYYENGVVYQELYFRNGQPDGLSRRFYPLGGLEWEETYAMGLRQGPRRMYSQGGKKIAESFYTKDTLDGGYTEWHENGTIKVTGRYRKGFFDGVWQYFDAGGYQLGEGTFSSGTGVQRSWYYGGKPQKVIHYLNNRKHGMEQDFDTAGRLVSEKEYIQDSLVSRKQYPPPVGE